MSYHEATENSNVVERLENDEFFFVRKHAARSLQGIEFLENGAIKELIKNSRNQRSRDTRWKSALVLGRIQQFDDQVLDALCDGVENCRDFLTTMEVCRNLGFSGG